MIDEDKNKLEKLEDKVEQLERQLQEKTSKEEAIQEMEARLAGYQDILRSDQGGLILKKNFVVENRKGIRSKLTQQLRPEVDNVAAFYFNDDIPSRLNHIFLGTASLQGKNTTSVIQGIAIKKEEAPEIVNNGSIQFVVATPDMLDSQGVIKDTITPHIQVYPTSLIAPGAGGVTMSFTTQTDINDPSLEQQHGFIITPTAFGTVLLGNLIPNTHNEFEIGTETQKLKNIHSVSTNFGDVGFQNGWSITETEKVGIDKKGLAILNNKEEVVCVISDKGLETNFNYAKTTKEERAKMNDEISLPQKATKRCEKAKTKPLKKQKKKLFHNLPKVTK